MVCFARSYEESHQNCSSVPVGDLEKGVGWEWMGDEVTDAAGTENETDGGARNLDSGSKELGMACARAKEMPVRRFYAQQNE